LGFRAESIHRLCQSLIGLFARQIRLDKLLDFVLNLPAFFGGRLIVFRGNVVRDFNRYRRHVFQILIGSFKLTTMKTVTQSFVLTLLLLLFFGAAYPLTIWLAGQALPHKAEGSPILKDGRIVGFENIGQNFSDDKYFWSRPSAVGYNAASTGGSNLSPTNPAYVDLVKARLDTFLAHNPSVKKSDVPMDLVSASGGGLDPHLSPNAARIQISRIAQLRGVSEEKLKTLVESSIEKPYLGFLGTERVNVLRLNLALDALQ
jgi:potassium-transporting ATPase KdpC subunit